VLQLPLRFRPGVLTGGGGRRRWTVLTTSVLGGRGVHAGCATRCSTRCRHSRAHSIQGSLQQHCAHSSCDTIIIIGSTRMAATSTTGIRTDTEGQAGANVGTDVPDYMRVHDRAAASSACRPKHTCGLSGHTPLTPVSARRPALSAVPCAAAPRRRRTASRGRSADRRSPPGCPSQARGTRGSGRRAPR
jgi:hypothetical protein